MSDNLVELDLDGFLEAAQNMIPKATLGLDYEAAARAMYVQRPRHTDPAHWETAWEDVPEEWKASQIRAARKVVDAALRQ